MKDFLSVFGVENNVSATISYDRPERLRFPSFVSLLFKTSLIALRISSGEPLG
jgi:hypothetical protein